MTRFIVGCVVGLLASGCAGASKSNQTDPWTSLFDGQSLGNWASTPFGGEGQVTVEDGAIVLPMGSPMTGVTWQGRPPMRTNYEVEFQAMRTLGNDFFCALTFPAGDQPCTLVLAGWGGSVVGLSNIDGADASQNETTTFHPFRNDQWYRVRLRVEEDHIAAWVDDKQLIDLDIAGKRLSIRPEVELSRPLGLATWTSEGRIKDLRWRSVAREP